MKKRIAALLMAVTVAISSMGIAFAAENGSVTLNGPDEAKAGNEIEVTVDLSTNPGLTVLGLRVAYDSEYLTLKNVVDGGIFEKLEKSQTYDVNPYVLNFSSATAESAVTATGTLATMTFEVAEDAPGGETEIICTIKEAYDFDLNDVSMDGDKITVAVDGVHQHSLTKVEAKEATCAIAGNNEYYTCSCGKVFKDAEGMTETTVEAETIAAKGHTWDDGVVTKEPTEDTEGEKTFTCIVEGCGTTKTEPIPALDHAHKLTPVEAKEATCTQKGNNAYYACSCGKVFKDAEGATETTVEAETIPAKGHTWDEGKVTKEPTCTEKGVKTYTCSVCGDTKTEEIATVAHQYNANGVCTVCGEKKPSGGGGGGGLRREYDITVEKSAHGTVTPEWDSAMKGDTVTLTVKPDKGYKLETLSVAGKGGSVVKVTEKNGVYSFDMPAYAVVVKATFVEENGSAVTNPFVDVKSDAYYYDAVMWAVQNGITGGKDATHFAPNETCTRAQAVTFLWRAAGSPAPKSTVNPFVDMKPGAYYYDAVLWAVENGITKGTTDTTFSPNATCSRAQIVTFLWRSQKSPAAGTVNPFTDVAAGTYYNNAVLWAVENSITGGTTATTFSPNNNCTRAQIVTFLYRNVNG